MHPELIKLEARFQSSILTKINDPWLDPYQVELWMKRDDLLHPVISGNKWRKLKFCLDQALSLNKDTLVSMGGVWSNHLHALACAGNLLGLQTAAFVRGDRPEPLNPTLADVLNWGMQLHFVSRSHYRQLRQQKSCPAPWTDKHNVYWLPEGGAVQQALKGVQEMIAEIDMDYDTLCLPCGTGTTLAGAISAVSGDKSVIGFSALKNSGFLYRDVKKLLSGQTDPDCRWHIELNYHAGGFARTTAGLLAFINRFEAQHAIALDPVYTGKMMYGLYDRIKNGAFCPGEVIIAIHTGGLQGKRGLKP